MAMTTESFKAAVAAHIRTFNAAGVLLNDEQDAQVMNLCVLIPEKCVSLLIGSGGVNVSEAKAATGCQISFAKNDESFNGQRKCFHSGTIAGVAQAVFVAASFISEAETEDSGIKFVVKKENAGAVIGKGGAHMKSIREVTGCNSNFEKEVTPAFGGRILTFRHPEPNQPLLMAQAVYMAVRSEGFGSPTQNDIRKMAAGGGPAPQDQGFSPYGVDMSAGFSPYGPAATQGGASKRFSPYGAKPAAQGLTCAYHGKKRGEKNLQPHPANPNLSICFDNDPCRGSAGSAATMCSEHGKKRGTQNLQPNPSKQGLFVCFESDPCK